MQHVLVTGGAGLIGRVLVRALRARIPDPDGRVIAPSSAGLDLRDRAAAHQFARRVADQTPVDTVFHLAGVLRSGDVCGSPQLAGLLANSQINSNLLELHASYWPSARLVSALSYCMYPPHERAHDEEELWASEPERELLGYATAKHVLLVGHRLAREAGLACTGVVMPTVYGPDGAYSDRGPAINALIARFARARRAGRSEVEAWGDGSQVREFVFVDDLVDALLRCATAARTRLVYNAGAGVAHTMAEVAALIARSVSFDGRIRFNPDRPAGVRQRRLCSDRIRNDLGWQSTTPLEEGIRICVQRFREMADHASAAGDDV